MHDALAYSCAWSRALGVASRLDCHLSVRYASNLLNLWRAAVFETPTLSRIDDCGHREKNASASRRSLIIKHVMELDNSKSARSVRGSRVLIGVFF